MVFVCFLHCLVCVNHPDPSTRNHAWFLPDKVNGFLSGPSLQGAFRIKIMGELLQQSFEHFIDWKSHTIRQTFEHFIDWKSHTIRHWWSRRYKSLCLLGKLLCWNETMKKSLTCFLCASKTYLKSLFWRQSFSSLLEIMCLMNAWIFVVKKFCERDLLVPVIWFYEHLFINL